MPYAMSNTAKGLAGALALTLGAMGAAQLAFGHDVSGVPSLSAASDTAVNREGKSDRAARAVNAVTPTQTISVKLNGFADTTIVMRIPLRQDARTSSSTPLLTTPDPQKQAVACEGMVSVLADVAKQLPPGRCVT